MKNEITFRSVLLGSFFLLGLGFGYILFALDGEQAPAISSNLVEMSQSGMHTHPMVQTDPEAPVPTVSFELLPDTKDGYNLHLTTEHFSFTPETVGTLPVNNEGHAHLYVNGTKVARLYGEWFNLSSKHLREGENLIEVTLNANDHSEWMFGEVHIATTTVLQYSAQ